MFSSDENSDLSEVARAEQRNPPMTSRCRGYINRGALLAGAAKE